MSSRCRRCGVNNEKCPMRRAALLFAIALPAGAQWSQRGFLEANMFVYPDTAPNDSAHLVSESLFRYEAFYKLTNLRFAAGVDARFDTHQQTSRDFTLSWFDRTSRRPAFGVRRLS